jgi:ectoine hydroxylase-related dioxygenase (phytanoyl-CoA dioxygenase family)
VTSLLHLPSSATVEEAAACVREHGYVVIDELVPADTMDRLDADLEPFYAATPFGTSPGLGFRTQRTGGLVGRSPTVRELVVHPLLLGTVRSLLAHASMVQLSLTEVITLAPGAEAQFLHQDELIYDGFPFDPDYLVSVNSLWAATEFTVESGATRIVPGSHRAGAGRTFDSSDAVPVEMARGSVLIFSGKLYHGGGENRSRSRRRALDLGFSVGWVRQEENQYLACPPEVARAFPEELLRLIGYDRGHGVGHTADRIDPITALGLA